MSYFSHINVKTDTLAGLLDIRADFYTSKTHFILIYPPFICHFVPASLQETVGLNDDQQFHSGRFYLTILILCLVFTLIKSCHIFTFTFMLF